MPKKKPNNRKSNSSKSGHVRFEFRKGHQSQPRERGLTEEFAKSNEDIDTQRSQRVSGKGELTRRRTIKGNTTNPQGKDAFDSLQLDTLDSCVLGRVLRVHGLESIVQLDSGSILRCAVRRVLKNLSTDQRHVVVTGDRVRVETQGTDQGWIVRIETRQSELARTSRQRRHVIAANIDQLLIVTSAAEPSIKPNLIDRLLATAEQNNLPATIVINKCDLIRPAVLQPLIGSYAQLGYRVLCLSAAKGWGVEALAKSLLGHNTVVIGQSGVGKSSLLNRMVPGLVQRVQEVSQDNQKGKHTTTTAEWFSIDHQSAVIDTPGVRQFQLWDIIPAELTGLFRDIRPFASHCRYPDCSHQHENDCAVKDAVADGLLDPRRYDSYSQILDAPAFADDETIDLSQGMD